MKIRMLNAGIPDCFRDNYQTFDGYRICSRVIKVAERKYAYRDWY